MPPDITVETQLDPDARLNAKQQAQNTRAVVGVAHNERRERIRRQAEKELETIPSTGITPTPSATYGFVQRNAMLANYSFAVAQFLLAGLLIYFTPNNTEALRDVGWWPLIGISITFYLTERFFFELNHNNDTSWFVMTEIPIALALVFISPVLAPFVRFPLTLLQDLHDRRLHYRIAFTQSMWFLELALAAFLLRFALQATAASDAAILITIVIVWAVVAPVSGLSRSAHEWFWGSSLRFRFVRYLSHQWWLDVANMVVGAATTALALIHILLTVLASVPGVLIWALLRRIGIADRERINMAASFNLAGELGDSLDASQISAVALKEMCGLLQVENAMLARFTERGPRVLRSGELLRAPSGKDVEEWKETFNRYGIGVLPHPLVETLVLFSEDDDSAVVAAPVRDGGEVVAVMLLARPQKDRGDAFDEADLTQVRLIVDQYAMGLRRCLIHDELEREATEDSLTGLPNRRQFEFVLDETVRTRSGQAWVLMLDLDRFKEVNDTLGHDAGDELLVVLSQRLCDVVGDRHFVARLAGDEFAMIVEGDEAEVAQIAETFVARTVAPFTLRSIQVVVDASIGVAEILDSDLDGTEPLRRADIAMYEAKHERLEVVFFRPELDRGTPEQLSILGELRRAIRENEISLVYQPKVDLASGRVVAVEALSRWFHPEQGPIAPPVFVKAAEDSGTISALTDYVLRSALRDLRRLENAGFLIDMAVNLSTHDLFDDRLPNRIRAYLSEHQVLPEHLTLELTETDALVDVARTRDNINAIRDIGVLLSLDDFGTGYSSLSYLRRLPLTELKLDRTFVKDMIGSNEDRAIVRSTINLGHTLGLRVVAEGVESTSVAMELLELGCEQAQGFGFARPMPMKDLLPWLRVHAHNSWPTIEEHSRAMALAERASR